MCRGSRVGPMAAHGHHEQPALGIRRDKCAPQTKACSSQRNHLCCLAMPLLGRRGLEEPDRYRADRNLAIVPPYPKACRIGKRHGEFRVRTSAAQWQSKRIAQFLYDRSGNVTRAFITPSDMSSNQPSLFAYSSIGRCCLSRRRSARPSKKKESAIIVHLGLTQQRLIGAVVCESIRSTEPGDEIVNSPGSISRLRRSVM